MTGSRLTDYDLVAYPARPFLQCHPDRLAVMAQLFGLRPEPVERCRVLEIGCGDGLNLMAASVVLPGAEFRGIDLSGAAIRRGRRMVRETGLKRVRLVHGDLAALDSGWGKFHYVVAHGLYSWVPVEVREALLAGIRQVLAPNGVAFVSYSVYPGAYLRQMAREMAVMFGGGTISGAREWLEVARGLGSGPAVYRAVLADEAADMLRRDDGALFHDDLASTNQPCYFRDFMGRAEAHGLQFVSEADGFTAGAGAKTGAETGKDRIGREQYADFLLGRRFRQTLLCHAGLAVASEPDRGALQGCFVGGPVDAGVTEADGRVAYVNRTGARVLTGNAAECRVLDAVGRAWPAYIPAGGFGDELLTLFAAGMLDIRNLAPPVGKQRPPEASPLARWQAARGAFVTSLHHMEILLGSSSLREVLSLADGSRTRAGLTRELLKLYPGETRGKVAGAVSQHLEELWQYGLLM